MEEADWKVLTAMQTYGGSFVQALAAAGFCADPVNLAKIKATWPEHWERYTKMAEKLK